MAAFKHVYLSRAKLGTVMAWLPYPGIILFIITYFHFFLINDQWTTCSAFAEFSSVPKNFPCFLMSDTFSSIEPAVVADRVKNFVISENKNNLPLRFTKAGRVWCDGARETH